LDEARVLLERARALAIETGERYSEAEIYQLDAELVLAESGGPARAAPATVAQAEELLRAAAACARRQGTPTLELRALTALVRLSGRGARGKDPRAALAALHASFTEGFETADLREARQALGKRA
jgi:adenylate cyclase